MVVISGEYLGLLASRIMVQRLFHYAVLIIGHPVFMEDIVFDETDLECRWGIPTLLIE